ncbi:uncharacterized protein LOC116066777 isoform X2 [Sander lucioperca]|uniref:uncharacterized protein LOC116066777 isoform X2 n=1 Tax=Sander lucioperca TaxID=283035 RepID=UPI0016535DE7|nr:uncharacterized protein LOC116066777 isoform X2 [Sander lucioperca]
MASKPKKRRLSKDLPPDLSELMNKLIKHAASFIREFDSSEQKMREIVREFRKIADEVRKMQETTDKVRTTGTVAGGVGIGLAIFAAPFTGGASLVAAGALAAAGAGVVVGANVTKTMKENGSAEKVEKLGKDFMKIVEPLKKDLEEIKKTCEKLEQRSAELQAENTLTDMEEFQRILTQVSELARRSEEVLSFTAILMGDMRGLLMLLVKVFRVTSTPEDDKKLRKSIIQSADRCQEVVVKFDQMKKELKDFSVK